MARDRSTLAGTIQQLAVEGLALLRAGDYWGDNQHGVRAKSAARDAEEVLCSLFGPLEGQILDLTWSATTARYHP